jgi:hypothetical protein
MKSLFVLFLAMATTVVADRTMTVSLVADLFVDAHDRKGLQRMPIHGLARGTLLTTFNSMSN